MGFGVGPWKTASLAFATDDDLTPEVDLGGEFQEVLVLVPTITSSTVTIHVAKESGGTFYPIHELSRSATGSYAHATTAAVTSLAVIFRTGAARFIKIACGSGQAADHDFLVRGINPV
jgi:hypothetical protein